MKKKIIALCLILALAVTAIGGATLAYFNDVTDEVKNTFTMGKVDIELDEKDVDDSTPDADRDIENDYTDAIVPGHVFVKDPTIHVDAKSEDCYVFMDVTINKFKSLAWVMAKEQGVAANYKTNDGKFSTVLFMQALMSDKALREEVVNKWLGGVNHPDWEIENYFVVDEDYLTIRLAYIGGSTNDGKAVVAKGGKDIKFMDSFQMPASVTDEMIAAGVTEGGMQNAFNTDAADFKMTFKAYAIQADTLDTVDAAYAALFN